jgi:hypothetical protein
LIHFFINCTGMKSLLKKVKKNNWIDYVYPFFLDDFLIGGF